VVHRHAGLDRHFGVPERNDVIQRLAGRWQLHQINRPFAPRRGRFAPQARSAVIPVDGVLIGFEIVVGLHEAKAFRVFVGEGVELQFRRVVQRAANPLAIAAPHRQAIRVMDLRVKGVAHTALMGAAAEHAGHGRNTHLLDVGAGVDVGVDVHDHAIGLTVDVEAIRASCAWRVQQR
nr:hypothetical protein [Tanacetum cinerariifolium]